MGTPDFAVPCLEELIKSDNLVAAVYCQPDKPQGRSMTMTPPAVKVAAQKAGIMVYQPTTLRDGQALEQLKEINPDIIIVVAYGKILPKEILDVPKYGCVNIHASLLPKYRGAGPIQWSVINGEKETGVTSMYMGEGLDTGDMILTGKTDIHPDETAEELHDRLAIMGSKVLVDTVKLIAEGKAPRTAQDDNLATYAPMLTKETGRFDFTKSAKETHNLIRGCFSWPCAYTLFNGKKLKVFSSKIGGKYSGQPGTLVSDQQLEIICGDGNTIILTEVALEGKKRNRGNDFINGHRLKEGAIFGR